MIILFPSLPTWFASSMKLSWKKEKKILVHLLANDKNNNNKTVGTIMTQKRCNFREVAIHCLWVLWREFLRDKIQISGHYSMCQIPSYSGKFSKRQKIPNSLPHTHLCGKFSGKFSISQTISWKSKTHLTPPCICRQTSPHHKPGNPKPVQVS